MNGTTTNNTTRPWHYLADDWTESVTWKEGCIINTFFFFSENAFSVFCDSFNFWILQQVYKKFSNLISILVISCLLQLFLLVKWISFGRMPEYFFCFSGMLKYSRIASWHRALFMFVSICLCFRGTPLLPRNRDIGRCLFRLYDHSRFF